MMSTNYQQLFTLTQGGQLELDWVIGPPRSCGNALHLLLTQGNEIDSQLDEPFHVMGLKERKYVLFQNHGDGETQDLLDQAFEDGCGHVLTKYLSLKQEEKKVRLIIHDISQTLSEQDFDKIARLSCHMVFTTRDPKQQVLSLLTRYTNDQWSDRGGSRLKTEDVLELMNDKTNLKDYVATHREKLSASLPTSEEELQQLRQATLQFVAEESNASWEQLQFFVQHSASYSNLNACVFKSEWLHDDPEKHVKDLSKLFEITYTSSMLNKWTKCVGKDFDCVITRSWGEFAFQNAWNGPARNSTGIEKQPGSSNQDIDLNQFPSKLHDTIRNCMAIYETLRESEH